MITRISGILIEKQPPELVIEVQGIAYEVLAPMTTFYGLPEEGSTISIYTHFYVKEDLQQLFGFRDKISRHVFRELLRTNGVGPKLALAILSGMDAQQLINTIMQGRVEKLIKIPGVGKKTAERLVIELKDRLKKQAENLINFTPGDDQEKIFIHQNSFADALQALVVLGYKTNDAEKALAKIENKEAACEEMIRAALRILA